MLLFPGGHSSADTECGGDLYRHAGHGLITFSRPGYGRTGVGGLDASQFVPAVIDCCEALGITEAAAVVGVSFGGLQAVQVAVQAPALAPRLVLHSCAPSTYPYPDRRSEALGGPIVFAPALQKLTWRAVRALVSTDAGLRCVVARLSRKPVATWWPSWTNEDRQQCRRMFQAMDSGTGFVNDLRQGAPDRGPYRRLQQAAVTCPTLVTASRDDRGVGFAHAQDLAATIPAATLIELSSPTHLFWIGPQRAQAQRAVTEFLAAAP